MPESAPSTFPIDVHASNISSYSVNISWLPPPANHQNGIIRWYEVLIYELDSEMYNLTVSSTYAIITGLSPYSEYNVSVSAYTISNGPYSEWITVTTAQDAPSAPPDYFNATVTSPYSALLTWDPPSSDQRNGIIINYVINVVILETGENFTLYSNTTSLFVDVLWPFRTFECIIAALTNVGVGPYSAIFTLSTPQDAPSSSPVQVRSTSVTSRGFSLYWDPPSYDDQNGVINYYIIRIIEVETGVTSEYTSYTTVLSLSSLHPAYTYYCSIAAYTVALGPFSIQFNVTTDEDVPTQAPVNFVSFVLSSSSVSLSWNPPPAESQNGLIISYHLNITTLATGSVSLYMSYDTTIQVNGLVPYTTYTCLIAAETSIGRGPYTTIITFTTMEDAPTSSPIIISHSIIDSHSVAIHWNPPSINHHNGIIRNYIVRIVEVSGNRNIVRIYNTTATTAVIGSLIPSYAYKFFIAASTIAIGPYTSVVMRLPEDIPSGYPKELAVNDTTPDSFTLTWDPLPYDEQSGDIIGYVVNVTHADTLSTVQYHTLVTNIVITGLDPYTTYVCVVAAETSVGVGPFSHLFFVQTDEAAPDSPPQHPNAIALSPTSIHITWDPPLLQDHNGVIREYRINVTEAVTSTFTEHVINQTQLVVTGLKPFHLYYCSIVAVTIDEGPYTVSLSVLTEEAAPSMPPQSLSVSVTSSRSLFMSWDIPPVESHNGIIREYAVIIQTVLTEEEQTYTTLNKFFNATGLIPYTTYRVKVAAVTVEAGPFTISHDLTTFEDNPTSPPGSFNATATDASSLFLHWAPPNAEGVNGVIQHYNISITEVETGIVTHYITTSVSYTLTDLHPFYTYKCTVVAVTIGAGPITSLTVQMPEDVPSTAPSNVLNTEVTSKSLTINWEALRVEDQNGLIRYYLINVTETDTGSQFQYTSTTIDITLTNLHPYYTYRISVSAFTISAGQWSDPIIVITAQDVPSGPPIDIFTSSITSTAATLEWLPPSPSERNGIIIGYNISIEDSLSGIEQDAHSVRPIFTINSLEPYIMYQYSIAALTTIGQGPYSTFLFFQTKEAAPSEAPESLSVVYITSTTATLTWDPPPLDSHNGVIREYTVRITGSDDQFLYNATKNSITIPDLLPYTDYEISVSAYTVANGPFSNYLSMTSNEAVPSASPSMISVIATNPSTLSLSWNPLASSNANGIVRQYIVDVLVQDSSEHYQYSTVNTSLILTELHPYYTYTVYIAAVTIDRGPFSAGNSIRMPQKAPSGSPNNVTGLSLNSTAIQVSWDPPHLHLQNGVITSYTIILLELRTNTSQLLSQNSLYTTVIISGLHPYYDYSISVAAYTVAVGPASVTTVRTLQDIPSISPQSLRVNFLSSTIVNIVWLPPHPTEQNGLISHYTVVLYARETKETLQYNTNQSSIELSGLHPFYNYVCHVAAVTFGPGPNTSISFEMKEDVPQGSPQNLTVTPLNQSTILIGWSPPVTSLQNGIIRSYTIYLFHNLTGLTDSYTVSNTTTHMVTNLKPFSVYSISVAASTIDIGPFSSFISVTLPEGVPSLAPSQFVAEFVSSGTALYFSWIQLPIDGINGILLGYQLSCSGQNDHTFSDEITGTAAYAYDVDKNTHYTCQVCAFTSVGCGPTAVAHISTYENYPVGPPHSLSANTTSTTIYLHWEAPFDPDSVILSYVVSYYLQSTSFPIETPRPRVSIAGINETSCLISSLLVSSTYHIEVFAVTKEESTLPTSEPINVTTNSLDSNSPKNFTCLSKSATSFHCMWLPPEYLNFYVQSYSISYRLAEGFDYYPGYGKTLRTINLHASTLEYNITGLQPYGGYVVELEAFLLPTIGSGYSRSQSFGLDEIKGAVTTVAVTHPETPSATVKNIYITVLISNTINVSWKPPKRRDWNGRIDFYKLILTLHDDVDLQKRAEPIISREILVKPTSNYPDPSLAKEPLQLESSLIDGLEENFEYSLAIVIYNAAGSSIVSEPTTQKMPQAAPSGPPVNITLKSVTTNTFNITWLPPNPLDANGIITGYHVIFNRTKINDISSYLLTARHNYFFKKGLHSYEMVSFKVAAKTEVGLGPFSSEIFFQTNEEIPRPPLLLRASLFNVSSVLLKWEPIKNEPVIEYEVFYTGYSRTTSNTDGPHQRVVLYSEIPQIFIVNLMSGYLYQFTVRTRNNVGVGGNSSVLIRIPGFETSPTHVGEVSGASGGINTYLFFIAIALALLIFVVCTIIVIVIIVFFKKNRSKRKQKFEPSMTNNPLSNLSSSDDSREMSLKPHNSQPEPTNHIEEINLNSMNSNESMDCQNIESNATNGATNIDQA